MTYRRPRGRPWASAGSAYQVVAPDQIGWGKSPKPEAARLGDFVALFAAAAQDIPRATRVVIPECGHIPHLEHPGQFLAELQPFLAS